MFGIGAYNQLRLQLLRNVDTSERFFTKGTVSIPHPLPPSCSFAFACTFNVFKPFKPKYVTTVYMPILLLIMYTLFILSLSLSASYILIL